MKLTDLFLRRPVLAIVVSVLIIVAGLQAIRGLNVRQYPKLESATVTVRTVYVGASADLVRGFITTPLERAIAASDGIDYIESQSVLGLSTINVRLKLNFNAANALADISARVNQVRADLPPEAQVPAIQVEPSDAQVAAMYLGFTSDVLQDNQVTDYLIRVVQPRLSAIAGVQRAEILGARTFALRAWLKPDRMAALNVTPSALRRALAANNYLTAAGTTKGALTQLNVAASTDLRSLDGFKRLVIREQNGALVRLQDVADVELGADEYDQDVRFSGQKAVFMGVWVLPSASALDVIGNVNEEIKQISAELPTGMQAKVAYDSTAYIKDAIHEVVKTLSETVLIVMLVIFLFLGSLRSALVPVVAIPVSLIGGVFLMQAFGFTLNLLTLLAIVLSVGLVVDDAIVVVENVERHIREGRTPYHAALIGARELVGPVIAMTITLAAVYVPIGIQGGLTGALFREFAFTLAGAVFISGIVALTLSPVMSSRLLRSEHQHRWFSRKVEGAFDAVRTRYSKMLAGTLNFRPAVYAVWIVLSLLLIPLYQFSPGELAPHEDQSFVFGAIDVPANATLEQVTTYSSLVGKAFAETPEFEHSFQISFPSAGFGGMALKPWTERKRSVFPIEHELNMKTAGITGIRAPVFLPPALPNPGLFPVEVVLSSTAEHAQLVQYAEQLVMAAMASQQFAFPPIVDVRIDQANAQIVIDRSKAASMGVTMEQLGSDLSSMLSGNFVNRFNIDGRSYKVIPQIARVGAADGVAAVRHLRHGAGRPADPPVGGRDHSDGPGAAVAEPVPAAERDQDLRPADAIAEGRPRGARDDGREDPAARLEAGLHGRVAAAPSGVGAVPARAGAGDAGDLPGAGRAVQFVPRPVRHPRRLGAAGDVRRADLHVPEVRRPARADVRAHGGLDDHAQHLLTGRSGHAGGVDREERHPHRPVRERAAAERNGQDRGRPGGGEHPPAPDPDDDRRDRRRPLPADAGLRARRRRA